MHATFKLDGCHVLEIGGDVPRDSFSPHSVGLQITKHPLPYPFGSATPPSQGPVDNYETVEYECGASASGQGPLPRYCPCKNHIATKAVRVLPGAPMSSDMTDHSLIYYGPHACAVCGHMIAKASRDQGGMEYDYPEGPIYPNTMWRVHEHRTGLNCAPPGIVVFACSLRPSEARAVASQILSAATEAAKGQSHE